MLIIVPPKKLKEQFPEAYSNLVFNAQKRLTSHFDIWRTIQYVINKEYLTYAKVKDVKYGISMMQPIPENRDCAGAGIPSHWCSCGSYVSISKDDKRCRKAGEILVNSINSYTSHVREKCVQYRDFTVKEAKIKMPNNAITIVIETKYSHAANPTFRSTIQLGETEPVITDIERIDRYGDQSMCIKQDRSTDMILIKLCLCKEWLEKHN